jgi:hypothetical protein
MNEINAFTRKYLIRFVLVFILLNTIKLIKLRHIAIKPIGVIKNVAMLYVVRIPC